MVQVTQIHTVGKLEHSQQMASAASVCSPPDAYGQFTRAGMSIPEVGWNGHLLSQSAQKAACTHRLFSLEAASHSSPIPDFPRFTFSFILPSSAKEFHHFGSKQHRTLVPFLTTLRKLSF